MFDPLESARRREGRRLAYYRAKVGADFWDRYWQGRITTDTYTASENGNLGWLHSVLPRYLSPGTRVLDAGCGPGTYVRALQVRGYRTEGVEASSAVVAAARQCRPDLPVRVGDATALDCADGIFDGYISLGVMEHRHEGPGAFLREARRVLAPGGVAFISVPYLHTIRRLKMRLGCFDVPVPEGFEFYQFAFDRDDFKAELLGSGFEVLQQMSYGLETGLRSEIGPLNWLLGRPRIGPYLKKALAKWEWGEHHLGHAILFVCRKT